MNDENKQMAGWAADALASVQIPGSQASNLLAVQQWLKQIANGELKVVNGELKVVALDDTTGASD